MALTVLLGDPFWGIGHGIGILQASGLLAGLLMALFGITASRYWQLRGLTVLLASVIAVCVAEVFLRLTLPIPPPSYGVWAGNPGSEKLLISAPDGFQSVHRYNTLGFRGPDISVDRQTPIRLICIGDSWTEGIGAQEGRSWPVLLQKYLPQDVCEVVNLGDSGSKPSRYLQILAHVGIPLRATHSIVCLIPSDFIY